MTDLSHAHACCRHKLHVIEALQRGDDVPAHVLRDYPDLAAHGARLSAAPEELVPAIDMPPDAFAELQREARAILAHAPARESLPFLWVCEVRDGLLCKTCKRLASSGLQGTGIYAVGDPKLPKLPAHPHCRCVPIFLTLQRAAERGIRVAEKWLRSGERPGDGELFVGGAKLSQGRDVSGEARDDAGRWSGANKYVTAASTTNMSEFSPANGQEAGYFWRVQPKGAELHSQKSTTSADEEIAGVMVFDNLGELAALDWMNDKDVELVKIAADGADIFHVGDQEGVGLRAGRGKIIARKHFKDVRAVKAWAQQRQEANWTEK